MADLSRPSLEVSELDLQRLTLAHFLAMVQRDLVGRVRTRQPLLTDTELLALASRGLLMLQACEFGPSP